MPDSSDQPFGRPRFERADLIILRLPLLAFAIYYRNCSEGLFVNGQQDFFFLLPSPLYYDRGVNGEFLLEKPLGLFFESTWAGCKHANEEVRQPGRKKKKKFRSRRPSS